METEIPLQEVTLRSPKLTLQLNTASCWMLHSPLLDWTGLRPAPSQWLEKFMDREVTR